MNMARIRTFLETRLKNIGAGNCPVAADVAGLLASFDASLSIAASEEESHGLSSVQLAECNEAGCSGLVIIPRKDGTSAAGCSPQPVSGGAMFAGPGACSSMQPLPSGEQERAECESDNGSPAETCLLYTSPSPRDRQKSRMPSSA